MLLNKKLAYEYLIESIEKFVNQDELIELMKKNRLKILSDLRNSERTYRDILIASKLLLDDCKKLGTIPFSTMARIAFISSIILKNMSKNFIIDCRF